MALKTAFGTIQFWVVAAVLSTAAAVPFYFKI